MPLQAIGPMMQSALSENYAVGYFESWSLESLLGVVDAAESACAPVILGFNGAFLSGDRRAGERLAVYAAMGKAVAASASVPCGLIFNECPRDDWVLAAIEEGFNLVMLADPAADPAALVDRVAAIAQRRPQPRCRRRGRAWRASLRCRFRRRGCPRRIADRSRAGRRVRRRDGRRLAGGERRQCPHQNQRSRRARSLSAGRDPRARAGAAGLAWGNGDCAGIVACGDRAWCRQGQFRHVSEAALSGRGSSRDRARMS